MSRATTSRSEAARDRAARWIVAQGEPGWSAADEAELDAWLAASDLHRVAYLRLAQGWRAADRMAALAPPSSTSPHAKVVPLRRPSLAAWVPSAIAASLALVIGAAWLVAPFADAPAIHIARYDTPRGGHRLIGLPDGTRIELNTASVVRAALGGRRREVWLDHGEAYFEVAHDKEHPFVVHAGNRDITVLGTKFSVRHDGDKVTVVVREGRVRVDDVSEDRTGRSATITGGDTAVTQGPATLVTAKSEERVESALAWREGMLSFDQERLIDVAAEFNRYNGKRLTVADAAAAQTRISGSFPASRPEAFVRLLREAYGLKIEENPEAIKISE